VRAGSPFIDPDGKWKLPPDAPLPAVAPFDATKAKQHQEAWAKYLGVPVEMTNSIGMKFVLIPPGEFDMGSAPGISDASECPIHRVRLSKPFYTAEYLVTRAEYERVTEAFTARKSADSSKPQSARSPAQTREDDGKRVPDADESRYPVKTVSWAECVDFCRRLSAIPEEQHARRIYRLPTEAEWEYACRAGTTTHWYCGDDQATLAETGRLDEKFVDAMCPVGRFKPNPWRLFDMHGSLWQWCSDWFGADYYSQSPSHDPTGPSTGQYRVLRGGAFKNCDALSCRSASRNHVTPLGRVAFTGFRVVCGTPWPGAGETGMQKPETGTQKPSAAGTSAFRIPNSELPPPPAAATALAGLPADRVAGGLRPCRRPGSCCPGCS